MGCQPRKVMKDLAGARRIFPTRNKLSCCQVNMRMVVNQGFLLAPDMQSGGKEEFPTISTYSSNFASDPNMQQISTISLLSLLSEFSAHKISFLDNFFPQTLLKANTTGDSCDLVRYSTHDFLLPCASCFCSYFNLE